jgi:hypothetical protein
LCLKFGLLLQVTTRKTKKQKAGLALQMVDAELLTLKRAVHFPVCYRLVLKLYSQAITRNKARTWLLK